MAKIIINEDLCKGCNLCIAVCPMKIIEIGSKLNAKGARVVTQVDEEKCTGCKLCGIMCPDAAISVYR